MDAGVAKQRGEEAADKVDCRCLALRGWTGATVVVAAAGTVVAGTVFVSVTGVAAMVAAVAVVEMVADGPFHRPWDVAVTWVLSLGRKACC
jgi:hypothetical protein